MTWLHRLQHRVQRLLQSVTTTARQTLHQASHAAHWLAHRVHQWVDQVRQQHRHHAQADSRYLPTLADGLVAAATTVIVQPMLRLVVTAVLRALLTAPGTGGDDEDGWDDSDYGRIDSYDAERAWKSRTPPPRPAWDIFHS